MTNVTLPASGSSGTASPVVEAATGPAGAARQVVTIGDKAGGAVDSIGGLTETAPASDTASSGLNGRLQRVAQRLTSLIALLPASLGGKTSAASFSVTVATDDALVGIKTETAPASDTASSGLNGRLQRIAQRLTSLIALFPTALTPAGAFKTSVITTNPTSVLTRPADTTPYAVGDLVASSTTGGSIVVPSFTATPTAGGTGHLRKARLLTNKTSGMGSIAFLIDFWQAAPTFTAGDNAAYAITTGAAQWLGQIAVGLTQASDGAYGAGTPLVGTALDFDLASGTLIYWTMQTTSIFTPASAQTFTIIPEIVQD